MHIWNDHESPCADLSNPCLCMNASRIVPTFLVLLLLMLGVTASSSVLAMESFLPDKQEILMMPMLCRWMYGARVGLDPSLIPQRVPMDTTGCTRFHYYCDANTDLVRAEMAMYTNPGAARFKLNRSIETLEGQIAFHNTEPCSRYLLSDINYTLGHAFSLMARITKSSVYYIKAIQPLNKSIELNSGDMRPYQALGEIYLETGQRDHAEEMIYKGLQINPQSKALLRMYKKVGSKRPLPTVIPGAAEPSARKDEVTITNNPEKPGSGINNLEATSGIANTKPGPQKIDSISPVQDIKHGGCRFCPDDTNAKGNQGNQATVPTPGKVGNDPYCRFCP